MTQRARNLKTLPTKQQHPGVLISPARLQHGAICRCKGGFSSGCLLPLTLSWRFFSLFLCYSPFTPNWPPIQRAPDLKSQTWLPWPWGKLGSCSSGYIRTVSLSYCPSAVPNKHMWHPKNVSELWSHPSHFHPQSLLWRNGPNRLLSVLEHVCIITFMKCVFIFCCYLSVLYFVLLTDPPPRSLIIKSLIRYT